MTKDVLVSLRGLQFDQSETESEKIETIMAGTYYEKNGKHYALLQYNLRRVAAK